jgi:hypothetical protein
MARVGRPGMTEAQKDEVWRCTPIAVVTLLLRSAHISWPPPHHGSISAVGRCADNAAAESFFGVLKRERVNRRQYRTRAEARADLFDYIERWHNPPQRRRLAFQQERQKLLTHVSVETG